MKGKRSELELKLLQMFMVGVPGTEIDSQVTSFLESYQPGGILYFAENYESPALMAEYSGEMQNCLKENRNLPLFIAVDQEGGKVQRLGKPFIHFPEAAKIGSLDSPKLAFDIAEVMSKELSAVGINLDFWPLCDINTRPSNPVIGKRAFGDDEELVSRISSAIVRGFVRNGMVACVKHFPGHGDTTVDSHKILPKSSVDWADLEKREIKPFLKAMRAKTDMFMTAHILNDKIDDVYPASISYTTITKLLRGEMRFNRIVISDDMQMDAISNNFNEDDVVALAINAGSDMLIYRDMERGQRAMDVALRFLEEGRISAEQVNESYSRIEEVKKRVLAKRPAPDIEALGSIIGCDDHLAVLSEIGDRLAEIN